jgi:hypothetical protein
MNKDPEDKQGRFIKLISMEGHEFFVDRRAACVSGTIKVKVLVMLCSCTAPLFISSFSTTPCHHASARK